MKIDQYLKHEFYGDYDAIHKAILDGRIEVNNQVIKNIYQKVQEKTAIIKVDGKVVIFKSFICIMMNKPKNYISAHSDERYPTVIELIKEPYNSYSFSLVGRLDADTEGLLLFTDSGKFAKKVIFPHHTIYKKYHVTLLHPLKNYDQLLMGVELRDGKNRVYRTLPCKIMQINEKEAYIEICEGKFHQIKRMFRSINNEVVNLKRIQIGDLVLDSCLNTGEYRELSIEEIEKIFKTSL